MDSVVAKKRQAGAIEITPQMIEAGRVIFDDWLMRWDHLAYGLPSDQTVDDLLRSLYVRMSSTSLAPAR
ncbi:hypothetical protein FRZ61_37310 [Hypericibacter adhaerens]|uniref:Uncharacterized protein n=1 Tax=Hypericibacter adhaerens TaxID=2602016 RepID=A0A5J6N1C4_9PROT|nr:hypothetical protein FRZ61_37310 [Hypericibacter adhaerens]